jgi:ferredoxin-NADP reductase
MRSAGPRRGARLRAGRKYAKKQGMAAQEYRFVVRSRRMLTPTVFEITFEPEDGSQPFAFEAGQFVSVVIPGAGPKGRDLRRAYSIASAPQVRPIELCVKLVEEGPGTNYLYQLQPGDTFRGYAPYGDFTFEPKPGRRACFIATGTGIAPFRSMVFSEAYLAAPPASTYCLLGVSSEAELLYVSDFELGSHLQWVPTVSRPVGGWTGFRGRVTDWLRAQQDFPWVETEYYLCGSGAMIDEVKQILAERGVAKECVHQEVYYKPPKAPAAAPAAKAPGA